MWIIEIIYNDGTERRLMQSLQVEARRLANQFSRQFNISDVNVYEDKTEVEK